MGQAWGWESMWCVPDTVYRAAGLGLRDAAALGSRPGNAGSHSLWGWGKHQRSPRMQVS